MSDVCTPAPNMKPFTVVLTGGIASGKTSVSASFSKLQVTVIDTDIIAREVVKPGTATLNQIVHQFGAEFLLPDGELNRTRMRQEIFKGPAKRKKLEGILHPVIHDEVIQRVSKTESAYCILVIPLYKKSPRYDWIDRVLVVDVPEQIQIQRVMARDEVSQEHAESILAAQSSRSERLALADDVIENSGTFEELQESVRRLHEKYLVLAAAAARHKK